MIRSAPNATELIVALENLDVLRLQNLLPHKLSGLDQATSTSADDEAEFLATWYGMHVLEICSRRGEVVK